MKYDVLLVSSALDALSKESQVGSFDSAQIVIDAFHDLKPRSALVVESTHTKKGGTTEGQTTIGNVSLDERDEEVTDVRGVNYTRVGKWKIWREVDYKNKNISRIWFVHFLSQGVHGGLRDREFFVEYDTSLTPKGFAYMGDMQQIFRFWFVTLYKSPTVIVFGEVSELRDGISVSIG